MHCVVGQLGLFLCGFLFGFKAFFRWFIILILHWFNHEEPVLLAAMFAAPWFIAMPTQSFGRSFAKLVACQFFWWEAQMATEGAIGLGMAGWVVTLVLHASWFNCSSWIRAKKIATIRMYSCRALTSPWISGFRPSMKVPKSCFSDQSLVWLDKRSNLVW
ncbi:hypothetical protein BHM03_00000813 [Ensete ventricosum]|nr:hypothetical protein BHM03_00000813 [Ensete ventricosum]